ncbi:MarR family winged helix-turn-helix transcriptional regulator [Phenylobacterium montanum]|uniref:Winged helix DNA-binding protein n=1 Tax=Phenylobacterium montanum TaxID=2823693 RepID=A0A975FY11_9CAUL|nr:MarR family transcriptional regulator [Caulobacter sp. S6]QUD86933.1 winged helix DNA-binding protein [Caulobacter sp. S6]
MTPTQELRYLILAAERTGGRMLAAGLKHLGLTPSQAEVLQVLSESGPVSLSTLGGMLVCESGSPSRLVAGLVARGLVAREAAAEDARIACLSLSQEGRALVRQLKGLDDELTGKIAASLTPKQVEAMVAGMRKLLGHTPLGQAVARRRGGG